MRIAHVITRMVVGGAQENTLFTVAGLPRRGHAVDLITGPTTGPEGSLVDQARAAGIPLIEVRELVRDVSPSLDWAAYRQLCGLFRAGGYDVIHTHSAKAGILGRVAARRASPASLVVHTIHGPSFYPHQPLPARLLALAAERLAGRFTDRFISVGEVMRDRYLAAGIGAPARHFVVYSGFDLEPYRRARENRPGIRREAGIPADAVVIGMIGRLFPLKGQEYLLSAFLPVARRFPRTRLLFVGDGVLRPSLEARARAAGIADSVFFAGLVPPGAIPGFVAAMDILAHPSLREGIPKAVAQAFAGGKPVVAFDADGARELVRDGDTGYLVPPRDAGTMAARLALLVENPGEATAMGRRGRELVERLFPVEQMVAGVEAVYAGTRDLHETRRRGTV